MKQALIRTRMRIVILGEMWREGDTFARRMMVLITVAYTLYALSAVLAAVALIGWATQ